MKKVVIYTLSLALLLGCSSAKRGTAKDIGHIFGQLPFDNQFTGLLVIDPETNDTIYARNSTKYFTPASNTKIFTLYASLQLLPDTIPALKYTLQSDTLYFQGTGDPSLLHPYLKDSTAIHFLKKHKNLALDLSNFKDEKYGPGWAWDDYQWYYSVERNSLPLYGNVLTIAHGDSLEILPAALKDSIVWEAGDRRRKPQNNTFYFEHHKKDTVEIPMTIHPFLTKKLLEKALGKEIRLTNGLPGPKKTLPGIASDSVYKRMMHVSDNFLAEQLLILASATLSDTLDSQKARTYVLENHLHDLRQAPRWVDGSGLSRYNLFSPESMVSVLQRMYAKIPRERLFQFFPAGGVSGTLEDWYPGNPEPYIYAKTGSLGNNHNVSGYLVTKSGKVLIFSFMNNHFMRSSSEIKQRMQRIFESIRDSY